VDRALTDAKALLPLEEARRRLHVTGQSYAGLQSIPLEQIIGTVDRSIDFDRHFHPRGRRLVDRLAGLAAAFSIRDFPPISVYELGGAYFVSDGHHRIALSHLLGRDQIDAEVTRLQTSYAVAPDIDLLTLVHTEQQRVFMEESGLAGARPDAFIEFTRPQGYAELLDVLRSHSHDLSRAAGRLVPDEESAADWYDNVYQPALKLIKATRLPQRYPFKTDADMYLWVHQLRRELQPTRPNVGWAEAAEKRAAEHHRPFFRWRHQRYRRRPLQRR
jgi:hypothetical protein